MEEPLIGFTATGRGGGQGSAVQEEHIGISVGEDWSGFVRQGIENAGQGNSESSSKVVLDIGELGSEILITMNLFQF